MALEDPEAIWKYAPNPKAKSSFKAMMAYGRRFPERDEESWAETEARQKVCKHSNGFQLIFRVKDGSDANEPEYEYTKVCPDCWFMKYEWK